MAEQLVMIGVPVSLRDWLREEAKRLELAWEERWYLTPAYNDAPANPTRPHVSLAAVIEVMLEARRKHRERRRTSALCRRRRRKRLPSAAAIARLGGESLRE